tara:strand:- start:93 stop:221 length:129 start_codon:yes stop_codon:yes gene_type:complete
MNKKNFITSNLHLFLIIVSFLLEQPKGKKWNKIKKSLKIEAY